MIVCAIHVMVERDGWDKLIYGISLAAAIAALIGFMSWALERHRRPELQISWEISGSTARSDSQAWGPNNDSTVKPKHMFQAGEERRVSVIVTNIGDRALEHAGVNFLVPECFSLEDSRNPEHKPFPARDPNLDYPPEHQGTALYHEISYCPPGDTRLFMYRLKYTEQAPTESATRRVLFQVSDHHMNTSGKRIIPFFIGFHKEPNGGPGSAWPPPPERGNPFKFWFRPPFNHIYYSRGTRKDVRQVSVQPATPEATT
jgi:hypothetical protein